MRAVRCAFVSLGLLAVLAVPPASACFTCNPFLQCVDSPLGGRYCVASALTCALLFPCTGSPSRETDRPWGGTDEADLTTFTLFDAAPGAPARVARGAGAMSLALGEDVRASAGVGSAPLAEAGVAHGRDFAGAFVDDAGEGFSLKRSVEGTQIRLEVRQMHADREGAVLASELLGEHDQLTVPVRIEGRDRVLVLSARSVPKALARFDLSRLTRSIGALGRANARRSQPLFRVHAL